NAPFSSEETPAWCRETSTLGRITAQRGSRPMRYFLFGSSGTGSGKSSHVSHAAAWTGFAGGVAGLGGGVGFRSAAGAGGGGAIDSSVAPPRTPPRSILS